MRFTSDNYKNIGDLYYENSETYDVTDFASGYLNSNFSIGRNVR